MSIKTKLTVRCYNVAVCPFGSLLSINSKFPSIYDRGKEQLLERSQHQCFFLIFSEKLTGLKNTHYDEFKEIGNMVDRNFIDIERFIFEKLQGKIETFYLGKIYDFSYILTEKLLIVSYDKLYNYTTTYQL